MAFALIASYLAYSWSYLRIRNSRSWQDIVHRLSPFRSKPATALPVRWSDWRVLYRDVAVTMEVADYAERNARHPNHVLLNRMRSDALWIRLNAIKYFLIRKP